MIVDVAAYLGSWPYRPIEGTVAGLSRMMRQNGLTHSLVSPFPGFFHTDPMPANQWLLRRLAGRDGVSAGPIINLRMADWQEQVKTLAAHHQVRAVRLAPGFHDYPAEAVAEAAEVASKGGLAVVVQLRMQDERSHPPSMRVTPVPLEEVLAVAAVASKARVVVAAARLDEVVRHAAQIRELDNLWLDTSHLDGLDCVKSACEAVGAKRLLFSTCWPFFYPQSAVLKIEEAKIPRRDKDAMRAGNARRVLQLTGG